MNVGKRIVAMALSVVLGVGLVPAAAFAVGGEGFQAASVADGEAVGVSASGVSPQALDGSLPVRDTCGGCDWAIDAAGKLTISPTPTADAASKGKLLSYDDLGNNSSSKSWPWFGYQNALQRNLYAGQITSVTIAEGVSLVGSAYNMFSGCTSLRSADLSGLNASNVKSVERMFYGCTSLKAVDLSSFDTCEEVQREVEGNPDVTELVVVSRMPMSGMFRFCSSLEQLTIGPKTKLSSNCALPRGTWTHEGTSSSLTTEGFVGASGESAEQGVWRVSKSGVIGGCSWSISGERVLTIAPLAEGDSAGSGVLPSNAGSDGYSSDSFWPWSDWSGQIREGVVSPGVSLAGNADHLFDVDNMTSLDLTGLDASGITSMNSFFSSGRVLHSVDIGLEALTLNDTFAFIGTNHGLREGTWVSVPDGARYDEKSIPSNKAGRYEIYVERADGGTSGGETADGNTTKGNTTVGVEQESANTLSTGEQREEPGISVSYTESAAGDMAVFKSIVSGYSGDASKLEYVWEWSDGIAGSWNVVQGESKATLQIPTLLLSGGGSRVSFSDEGSPSPYTAAGLWHIRVRTALPTGEVLVSEAQQFHVIGLTVHADYDDSDESADKKSAVKGSTVKSGGASYKVTKTGKSAAVSFSKAPKSKKSTKVPATVTAGGKKYAVTGIAKGAFKGSKVKTVTVKSKKLTKKSVKGCFKGSKVKTVKVPKSKLKAYKKIFTKKNCGAKVKVVRV